METEKIIEIQDMDNTLKFKIVVMDAMAGLDFIDKIVGVATTSQSSGTSKMSIKPFLSDLLPCAYLLDQSGNVTTKMTLDTASVMFKSPIAILDLGFEILDMQSVFLNCSPRFRELMKPLANLFPVKPLKSTQQS